MENNSNNIENPKIFQIRPTNEEKSNFIITIGDKLATKKQFQSEKEAQKYINARPWELIFALAITVSQRTWEIKEAKQEKKIQEDAQNVVEHLTEKANEHN